MAEPVSPIQFEDVPLEEARRMGRGPRMDPQLYQELRSRIESLSDQAVRMAIPDGTSQATMKNRIRSVATELGIPVTIRRVSGGLLFWRSTDEDIRHRLAPAGTGRVAPAKGKAAVRTGVDAGVRCVKFSYRSFC
jgi:hypothetical protein